MEQDHPYVGVDGIITNDKGTPHTSPGILKNGIINIIGTNIILNIVILLAKFIYFSCFRSCFYFQHKNPYYIIYKECKKIV